MTCEMCGGAGWAKCYVVPGENKAEPVHLLTDGKGIRWLGGSKEGYWLVYCPSCATAAGRKAQNGRERQGVPA